MTEHGFTPGPWRVMGENYPECWIIKNKAGNFIAQCENRHGFSTIDAVGNARLIAASPTLLEAAIAVLQTIDAQYAAGISCDPAQRDALRAAITLATGKDAS